MKVSRPVKGVTTGISAHDRGPHDSGGNRSNEPAHLRSGPPRPCLSAAARKGGVLVRAGQTEASVDLARNGRNDSRRGSSAEIMNEDGTMARVADLTRFCGLHGLKMLTVAELIRYRLQHERYIAPLGRSHAAHPPR